MTLLTNENVKGYEKILEMENMHRIGRKILWIGAQMRRKNQWFWYDHRSSEWPWNGLEVQDQPWGLQEPSGENCVVTDSALQWKWNSIRCVISAHVVCQSPVKKCPNPDVNPGSYLKLNKSDKVEYECHEAFAMEGNSFRKVIVDTILMLLS